MAELLDVYLNHDLAGELEESQGKLSLTYRQTWLDSGRFIPLSVTMGPQREPFPDAITRPFFENLLPEGAIRRAIAKLKQLSERNTFALLGELGGDCAGAVSLWRHGEKPRKEEGYAALSDARLAEVLAGMAKRPLIAIDDELRLSLAGAQNKLPVHYDGTQLSLPRGSSPSSHILKPGARGFGQMPANENFCMHLAGALALSVPGSIVLRKPEALYLVERYDRVTTADGSRSRVHQIDFCQALNLPSHKKYEHEGGPSLAACFDVIARFSTQPARDRLQLISWVVFNYLIGNADAHAKNLSLLITSDGVLLAPFYDLVSTAVYGDLTDRSALRIGGESRPDWTRKRHWEKFAEITGANPRVVWSRIAELSSAIPDAVTETARQLNLDSEESAIIAKILGVIETRSKSLKRLR